jgi:hypothetical protein
MALQLPNTFKDMYSVRKKALLLATALIIVSLWSFIDVLALFKMQAQSGVAHPVLTFFFIFARLAVILSLSWQLRKLF